MEKLKNILLTLGRIGKAGIDGASLIGAISPVFAGITIITNIIATQFKDKPETKFDWINKIVATAMIIVNEWGYNYGKASNDPKQN